MGTAKMDGEEGKQFLNAPEKSAQKVFERGAREKHLVKRGKDFIQPFHFNACGNIPDLHEKTLAFRSRNQCQVCAGMEECSVFPEKSPFLVLDRIPGFFEAVDHAVKIVFGGVPERGEGGAGQKFTEKIPRHICKDRIPFQNLQAHRVDQKKSIGRMEEETPVSVFRHFSGLRLGSALERCGQRCDREDPGQKRIRKAGEKIGAPCTEKGDRVLERNGERMKRKGGNPLFLGPSEEKGVLFRKRSLPGAGSPVFHRPCQPRVESGQGCLVSEKDPGRPAALVRFPARALENGKIWQVLFQGVQKRREDFLGESCPFLGIRPLWWVRVLNPHATPFFSGKETLSSRAFSLDPVGRRLPCVPLYAERKKGFSWMNKRSGGSGQKCSRRRKREGAGTGKKGPAMRERVGRQAFFPPLLSSASNLSREPRTSNIPPVTRKGTADPVTGSF
ncbi:hypothetical protein LptCag_1781 [Leptospirillum ferriphilum]|uniref:Uncharacterized protein n=1 Tax=Leptospirillum ferriphilum TaxID=178606 RepID=A0A094YIT2_9BACT|nr:hypothetical protein LptCag_1781 [Leptospirillum ferriphilum]